MKSLVVGMLVVAGVAAAHPVAAPSRADVTVRIRVVDSANAPVENVAVSVIRGVRDVLAAGGTDRNGMRVLSVSRAGDLSSIQLVARKVGYQPAMRIVPVDEQDTISATLVLHRVTAQLDTVRVTAQEDMKRRRTYVDADAIAAFDRPLYDVADVIEKMRRDMLLEPPDITGHCVKLQNVWVNGKRVAWFLPSSSDPSQKKIRNTADAIGISSRTRIGSALAGVTAEPLSVIASIQPEHVASIEYHDCMSNKLEQNGGSSALFITLKEGVAFDDKLGSYVIGSAAADSIVQRITLRDLVTLPLRAGESKLPAWRLRIVGVFDEGTGAALADVDVVDVQSGVRARTTETGTIALAFLDPGASRIAVTKAGYRTEALNVTISPSDTLPITILLVRGP